MPKTKVMEQRLLIVSNRLPVSIEKRKGALRFRPSSGGLVTGLESSRRPYNNVWVGWPGIGIDEIPQKEDIEERLISDFSCWPVFLSKNDIEKYYHGFSNKTLWPLSHYFVQYMISDRSFWEAYRRVNELFADVILEIAKKDDIIWIHDYHLMLLPKLIRERLPDVAIGYFHHIPFPSFEIFRLLPWRKEILEGVLGADVVGFHTYDYTRHFLSSVHQLLGYEHSLGQIHIPDRTIRVDAFPLGINYERFSEASQSPKVQREIIRFSKRIGDRKIILSVDRLDYSKGVPERLEAFNHFLKKSPEYKEKVTFILVAVPSRTQVEHYRLLKKQVDELVGKINGEHGLIGWMPIWYLYRFLPFESLTALYNIADVALITPVRDGMNLIAKEYIATKEDGKGVLILSEMVGAAQELWEAIIVNPNNKEEVASALQEALTMQEEEQIERNRVMQERIRRYNVSRWTEEFIDRLICTKKVQRKMHAKILTLKMKKRLIGDYLKSKRRLLLLDYDGTLVPFFGRPGEARPQDELLDLLKVLSQDSKNEVVLISGRDKDTLKRWFGNIDGLGFVAEHGVWIKEEEWKTIEPLTSDWKGEIYSIIESYMDRTPRSFIEEKEFSLVWHYRNADSELSLQRVRELTDELVNLTANLNLQVLEGDKVVEVKNVGINKGRAALRWITKRKWGFILAIGDDWTDEDTFKVLPKKAYSIKVGQKPSLAKFNLGSPNEVLSLLQEIGSGK